MINNRSASVKMEEGYMRLTIQYSEESDRSLICDIVGKVENMMDIYPEVIHRRLDSTRGSFAVEFGGDDHMCSRSCGAFIEETLKRLDITARND